MNIIQATSIALATDGYITKREENGCYYSVIKPTNTSECCIVSLIADPKKECPRWNPTADDLLSDNWITWTNLDLIAERQRRNRF